MDSRHRKILLLVVKIVIALVLLVWVFGQVHWHDYVIARDDGKSYAVERRDAAEFEVSRGMLWWRSSQRRPVSDFKPMPRSSQPVRPGFASSISRVKVPLLLCAIGGFFLSLLIVAVRWWLLLRIQEIHIRLWESVRLTFLGQFFNAVVPGTVGGDLIKAYYVSRGTSRKAAAMVSVFVDRIMGLTELTLLAAVMLAVVWVGGLASFEELRTPAGAVAAIMAIVIVMLTFLLSGRFRRMLHLQWLYKRLPIAHHIAAAGEAATLYRRRIGGLIRAMMITFGAHVIWVGSIGLIGVSLSLPTPWYNYFVYVPLIYTLGSVPLTPGGVGIVEKFYVVFFVSAQLEPSMILPLAMLARLFDILRGLPGAVVAVAGPKLPVAETIQAELGLDPDAAE